MCSAYVQKSALNKACISSEDLDMGLRSHSGRRRKCSVALAGLCFRFSEVRELAYPKYYEAAKPIPYINELEERYQVILEGYLKMSLG